MLHRYILCLFLLFPCFLIEANAQEVRLDQIRKNDFRNISPIVGAGFCAFYYDAANATDKAKFALVIFDKGLQPLRKFRLKLPNKTTLTSAVFDGDSYLFVFKENDRYTTVITLDRNGKQLALKQMGPIRLAKAANGIGKGFFLVTNVKGSMEREGFLIEYTNKSLEGSWAKRFFGKIGRVTLDGIESMGSKLYMVHTLTPDPFDTEFYSYAVCLDTKDGSEVYRTALFDKVAHCKVSCMYVSYTGELTLAGIFFDGVDYRPLVSDGLFLLQLTAEGTQTMFSRSDWEGRLNDSLAAVRPTKFNGPDHKALVHQIHKLPDGGFRVVGETYRDVYRFGGPTGGTFYGFGGSPMGFEMMDLVYFDYNEKGRITKIKKIDKPHLITYSSGYDGKNMALSLQKAGKFTYLFSHVDAESRHKQLVYSNLKKGKAYIGVHSLSPTATEEDKQIVVPQRPRQGVGVEPGWVGAYPAKPGQVMVYEYSAERERVMLRIEEL